MTGSVDGMTPPAQAAVWRSQLEAAGVAAAHGIPPDLTLSTDPVDQIAADVITASAISEHQKIHEHLAAEIINRLAESLTANG